MKKAVFVFALFFVAESAVFAQIEKGSGILSLDVPFSISAYRSQNQNASNLSKNISFQYSPSLSGGYFVTRNLMLGGNVGFNHGLGRSFSTWSGLNKFSNPVLLNTGISLRYYHFFNPKVGIYGEFSANYLRQMNKTNVTGSTLNGIMLSVAPRLVYMPRPDIGINLGFGEVNYGYLNYRNNTTGNTLGNDHRFNFIPSLNIGVSYIFRKKK